MAQHMARVAFGIGVDLFGIGGKGAGRDGVDGDAVGPNSRAQARVSPTSAPLEAT
jgi:hypothetical protein